MRLVAEFRSKYQQECASPPTAPAETRQRGSRCRALAPPNFRSGPGGCRCAGRQRTVAIARSEQNQCAGYEWRRRQPSGPLRASWCFPAELHAYFLIYSRHAASDSPTADLGLGFRKTSRPNTRFRHSCQPFYASGLTFVSLAG